MDRMLSRSQADTPIASLAKRRGQATRRLAPAIDRMMGASAHRIAVAITVACAILLGIFLLREHTSGGELMGPVAAVAGIAAGGLSLAAGSGPRRRLFTVAIVTLWTAVVFLGVAGTLDHTKAVKPEYTDQRPRPAYVPLVFAAIGGIGIATVVRSPGRKAPSGSSAEEIDR